MDESEIAVRFRKNPRAFARTTHPKGGPMKLLSACLRRSTKSLAALTSAAVLALAACSGESITKPADPNLPGDPVVTPAVANAAWRFDVSTSKKTVKVTAPSVKATSSSFGAALAAASGTEPSLLGGDAINLVVVPGTYNASGIGTGGASAGKVLVSFQVQIVNLLSSIDLITPTFPVPPSAGVFMFPFSTNVTTTSGGAAGSGNDIIVDLPNRGQVAPSTDFNGAPYNWFNDTGCPAGSNDCYRYETYPGPIPAGSTTAGQLIGFEIDPTVANFSAKLIVAADVQNSGPAVTRTVTGSVTSNNGAVTGGNVTIGAASNAPSAGVWSIANVGAGVQTVSYAAPAGCTPLSQSQSITITSASPTPVVVPAFTITCPTAVGTVSGSIAFQTGSITPSLATVTATLTPAAASAVSAALASGGPYSSAAVPVGTGAGAGNGTVSFSSLPAGCSFVGATTASWTGLTVGGTRTASAVTINCITVITPYPLLFAWTGTGASRTLTVTIDMNAQNSALNNGAGADLIGGFQATLSYPTSRLSAPVCSSTTLTGTTNLSTAGQITWVLTNVPAGAGGLVTLATCNFTNTGTGPTAISLAGLALGDPTGSDDFTARTAVTLNQVP